MSNVYRMPDRLVVPPVAQDHRGPLYACPMCGRESGRALFDLDSHRCFADCEHDYHYNPGYTQKRSAISAPVFCSPAKPVVLRRPWYFLGLVAVRCARPDVHLHQSCASCGGRWTVLPIQDNVSP